MSKENFGKAFDLLIEFEGGYVNDKADPGGATKYGISKRAYPDEDIANLTLERAKELYQKDYWNALGCDDLPDKMDITVFDCGVNCGVNTAKKLMALSKDWKDLLINRIIYYRKLAEKKPALVKFYRGWVNRCLTLYTRLT